MKQTIITFAGWAALGLVVLMGLDQLNKAHKKNQLPHITNNAMLLAASIAAIILAGFIVYPFTSRLGPLLIFASLACVIVGSGYVVIFKRQQAAAAAWEAELADDERRAGETVSRDPSNAAAWDMLSRIKEKRGDLRGALEMFERVCRLDPSPHNDDRLSELRQAVRDLGGGERPR